jgi:hypothetical protein
VRVLFDNNLPPRLARALNELFAGEHEIVALRDKFAQTIRDVEWIQQLSREGTWVVVSGDRRITRNRAERDAFRNSRLIGFFLAKGLFKSKLTKQAERILALWENIEKVVGVVQSGAMFELPMRSTRIKQLKD